MRRSPAEQEPMKHIGHAALVAVLVVVNLALIGYAVAHHQPKVPALIVSPPPAARPTHHPVTSGGLVSAASIAVHVAPLTLVANRGTNEVWTAVGGCSSAAPNLSLSEDGGTTYAPVSAPAPHLLALSASGAGSLQLVGADSACVTPLYFSTKDYGKHWKSESSTPSSWWQTPVGLHSPAGSLTSPCPAASTTPVAFGGFGLDALAACRTGLYRTVDGGVRWQPAGRLPANAVVQAVAMSRRGRGVLAMTKVAGCRGARTFTTNDSGLTWKARSCLIVARAPMVATLDPSGRGLLITKGGTYGTSNFGRSFG
jgi:hypothetical protein